MTTDCIDTPTLAERYAARRDVSISPTEWGLVAIIGVGFLLMLPAATFIVSHLLG